MAFKKHDLIAKYNLPKVIQFCNTCTMSNQRPRITFDESGRCSACVYSNYKKRHINWEKREDELMILCDRFRKNDGSYDVIVPCSGGKDGSFTAHQLKYKYGMNPLTVTWAPHLSTSIGRKNLDNFIDAGFDNILGKPKGDIHRILSKLAFIHLGDNFQPFIYGQTNFPLTVAVQHGISLIMYGENGEVEYGGDMKNAESPTREIMDHDRHYFSGLPPLFWERHGISKKDLFPYLAPKYSEVVENQTEIHFFGYYKYWDPQENYYYCIENTGFLTNSERSEGTYSKYASLDDKLDGLHYYLSYIKFGLGRATNDTAHEIRDGKITREEGIALVERYDGEFPSKYFSECLKYLDISEEIFWQCIDSWRSDHIWQKKGDEYFLRNPVYKKDEVLEP